jgi:hypothetical protein
MDPNNINEGDEELQHYDYNNDDFDVDIEGLLDDVLQEDVHENEPDEEEGEEEEYDIVAHFQQLWWLLPVPPGMAVHDWIEVLQGSHNT